MDLFGAGSRTHEWRPFSRAHLNPQKEVRPMKTHPVPAAALALTALVSLPSTSLHVDAVTEWNAIMQSTVAPTNPFAQGRSAAIVQLAVFEAVNAIIHKTDADPVWLPLIATPPFPSYPSAHASAGGAARAVLEHLYGEDGFSITLTNPTAPGVVLHYTAWEQITDDIDDARIYGGIHFRFDQEAGARQGLRVGRYMLRSELRPVRLHNGVCEH